jgi:hypothetical protein
MVETIASFATLKTSNIDLIINRRIMILSSIYVLNAGYAIISSRLNALPIPDCSKKIISAIDESFTLVCLNHRSWNPLKSVKNILFYLNKE